MQKDVILTPEGLEKLKDEIEYLSTDKRREVAERIKEAREFGDISENSEYDDAKNEQAMLEARIAPLEEQAALGARSIDAKDLSTDVVRVGSVVHVKDEKTGKSRQVHDRRLDRGRPGREQALQRVAGRQGAARATSERRRSRCRCRAARRASSRSPRSTSACRGARMSDARAAPAEQPTSCSPPAARKLDALREAGIDPFPHAYPGVAPIADVQAAHDGPRGRRGDRRALPRRRPPGRAPRPGQDGVPRPRRPLRAHPAAGARRRARRGALDAPARRSTSAT